MLPGIRAEHLTGAVRYFDGFTSDARLVIDTLRSAARHGAIVLNYCELREAAMDGPGWRCGVRDIVAGADIDVKARCVVNATGPWAALIPHSRLRLRLTKGVHLVIDSARSTAFRRLCGFPAETGTAGDSGQADCSRHFAVVMTAGDRILFAIPWGERVILGTTDTDYAGPPENVAADAGDVAYILDIVNRHFPDAALSSADVIRTWAGVRPLIATGHGGPSDISRAHQILMPEPGWFDVAGGKLTTYRRIAEQVVDRVVEHAGPGAGQCRTAVEPLLLREPDPASSGIVPPPMHAELVEHYCRDEWAIHLEDVMVRRAGWHYYHSDALIDAHATRVATWMAAVHGWDTARQAEELARYNKSLLPAGNVGVPPLGGDGVKPAG
jgi:glycerol-3-phosphate dehydrogenase